MSVSELVILISDRLKKIHEDPVSRQQDAWWILQAITKKNEAQLLAEKDVTLTATEQAQLEDWLKKHVDDSMPLQYLLGTVPFGDLEMLVEPPTLIPRPETEEWCLDLIGQLKKISDQRLTILDIGSGTGCIALTLAKHLPLATVYAVDISEKALALSKKNAQHNRIKNITFLKSDIFSQLEPTLKFDLIVSNPPYISQTEWETLEPSVTKWEDPRALMDGPDGLNIIRNIIEHAPRRLKLNSAMSEHAIPQLMIEIGYQQGPAVLELLTKAGFRKCFIKKDLEGKDRVACAEL